jgi:hypothetical protein
MPHNRQIKQFIQACPRNDWVMFCYDRPDFLPFYNELKVDTNLAPALARYLVENPDLVEPLLACGQKRHPQLYARYIGKGQTIMPKFTPQKIISFGIIIVMALGGICELWMVINPPRPCSVSVQDFAFTPKVVRVNETVQITVNIDNPKGLGVTYNWSITKSKIDPTLNSDNPNATYTAPNDPGSQTITVKVLPVGCDAIEHSEQIAVSAASSAAPPPAETLPFATATADEKLIVVMKFDDRSEGELPKGIDPSSYK